MLKAAEEYLCCLTDYTLAVLTIFWGEYPMAQDVAYSLFHLQMDCLGSSVYFLCYVTLSSLGWNYCAQQFSFTISIKPEIPGILAKTELSMEGQELRKGC